MPTKSPIVIFTDLDGTLLSEETYEPGPARPVLARCRRNGVPVVFCSSKTAAEIIALRETLGNTDPFICENGGAIYLPAGRFTGAGIPLKREGDYEVIPIGTPISPLRKALHNAAMKTGAVVKGMGEMSLKEVGELTGLNEAEANLAMKRRYDEPFLLVSGDPDALEREIRAAGYTMTRGGRFFHILGGSDKGKAVRILSELYRKQAERLLTAGLGDAENDLPMFQAVEYAFLVQKPGGHWVSLPRLANLTKIRGVGPEGWAKAVGSLLDETGYE